MKIKVSIDLSKINISDLKKKRTIKEGRMKHLNIFKKIYKSSDEHFKKVQESVDLIVQRDEDFSIYLEQYQKENLALKQHRKEKLAKFQDEYEPIIDFYPPTPSVSQCVEQMSLHLHLLMQDYYYHEKIKKLRQIETDPTSKIVADRKYKEVKKMFLESTKKLGLDFVSQFKKIFKQFNKKNFIMMIFVEVVKSQMKRQNIELKGPSGKQIYLFKNLVHGMFTRNNCKDFDCFFELPKFEELFNKAYSLSLARNLESPNHLNTP